MNILHVSTLDTGGAGRAALRVHQAQSDAADLNSQMLVKVKTTTDSGVIASSNAVSEGVGWVKAAMDYLVVRPYIHRQEPLFSSAWFPDAVVAGLLRYQPDIVNLHWINGGYLGISSLARIQCPIVWTLHDMWAFTGGCHYSQGCERYADSCGACPHLASARQQDLSRWVWSLKSRIWSGLDLTIVTPSEWLADCARASSLLRDFPIQVIPYCIDTTVYRPFDKCAARDTLGLPQDKQLILFGAANAMSDPRKGFQLLQPALDLLRQSTLGEQVALVVFGSGRSSDECLSGIPLYTLGDLSDDTSLASAYSAADVFIAPSVQDNLPNTVIEALACGTPCISFAIGGLPDLIEHKRTGYLAEPFDTSQLAGGVIWVLEDMERHNALCSAARDKVLKCFLPATVADRYRSLYTEILERKGARPRS